MMKMMNIYSFFIGLSPFLVIAITPSSQIEGLEYLFNATNGTYWNWRNEEMFGPKWSFTRVPQSDPCNDNSTNKAWQGITCSSLPILCQVQVCEIVSLTLNSYDLDGSLPSEFFVRLTSLVTLQLSSSTKLIGSIPSEIGFLTQLNSLSLYLNQLTGNIPDEIALLTSLNELYLDSNRLKGSIPSSLSLLTQLRELALSRNQLTGTIPAEITLLQKLQILYLGANKLTGTIPLQINSLSQLNYLSLESNQLTGTLPSALSSLSLLITLDLGENYMSGTIPTSFDSFHQLVFFNLGENDLTGTLPSSLSLLSQLNHFYVASNQLTGSIPSEFAALTLMDYFSLHSNQFTGTIPYTIFMSCVHLLHLYLSSNYFSGTIPSEIGSLVKLEDLHLFHNSITGTIPSTITNLKNLLQLHLYENHLHGQINFKLDSFPFLQQLFLQQNHFHGHLNYLFSPSISLNYSNHPLMNIDVSDNQFSGSIPSQLFLYQNLQSISLSLNCFQHELPLSMCEAVGVEVISMDGLGASKHCPNLVKFPFTSVSLVQSIEGSIPDCVWLLSNLKTLNLAGNGLSGRIGKISSMSSLLSLTLSHNYFSGTIPLWLQEKNMSQLDLSHNKLTGRVDGFKKKNQLIYNEELVNITMGSYYEGRSLKLSVNRLSGDLSHSFDKYSILDILSGNLFGCDYIPSNDENSDSTICGSEEFDQSMITMGGVCGLMVMLMIFYGLCLLISLLSSSFYLTSQDLNSNVERGESLKNEKSKSPLLLWIDSRLIDLHLTIHYLRYYSIDRFFLRDSFNAFRSFGYLLSHLIKSVCLLTIVLLLLSLPIYILKVLDVRSQNEDEDEGEGGDDNDQSEYITHSEMYRWLWTMSFVSGTVPAVLMMIVTFLCLMFFCLIMNGLGASDDKNRNDLEKTDIHRSNGDKSEGINSLPISSLPDQRDHFESHTQSLAPTNRDKEIRQHLVLWMIFIVNIAIVGTVNALYLWSTLEDLPTNTRILIQFSFGLFTFAWRGIILRRGLPSRLKESRYGLWLFTCLNIMNTVVIPCVVTALSDPSCYQRLLFPPDEISSSFIYQTCYIFLLDSDGTVSCLYFGPSLMNPLKITPPFSYSYQCGSTLLVSYIPVYMYSVSLQLLTTLMKLGMSFTISSEIIQSWLIKSISLIHFPRQVLNKTIDPTIQLIKPHQIISLVMNNLILLLSFGLCSSVLACCITLNICVILMSWLLLIGRFVRHRLDLSLSSRTSSSLLPSGILNTASSAPVPKKIMNNPSQVEMNPIQLSCGPLLENEIVGNAEGRRSGISFSKGTSQPVENVGSGVEGDVFLNLLNLQLQGVNSSLVVCKWPIVCTSCLFVTLLCWDMVGDEVGWFEALWVPEMGVVITITIWVWDRFLITHVLRALDKHKKKYLTSPSPLSSSAS